MSNISMIWGMGINQKVLQGSLLKQIAFKSGTFDFATNVLKDISGKSNDATLVGGYCVIILQNTTLALKVKRIGATITKVNDSALLTSGVAINVSGDIVITVAGLTVTDGKIWNIFLSTGEEFRFTSGVSPFIFASNNIGTLSGVENTTWAWSKTNLAHLNLRYGCSRMPYSNLINSVSIFTDIIYLYETDSFELYWEGILLRGLVYFNISIYTSLGTKSYAIGVNGTNIEMLTRTTLVSPKWTNPGGIDLSGYVKIKIKYNGGGLGTSSNFIIEVNSNSQTATDGILTTADRSGNYWAGNSASLVGAAVRNHYIANNDVIYNLIKDGESYPFNQTRPAYYISLPVFGSVDACGEGPLNPAFTNAHNGSETKIKMPVNATLFANDVNGLLYTDVNTPKELILSDWYSNYNSSIFLDNSIKNKYSNLIITEKPLNLLSVVNAPLPKRKLVSIRTDQHGNLLGRVLNEQNVKADTHITHLLYFEDPLYSNDYASLLGTDNLSISIHDLAPCFWQYKDYNEGLVAYNTATAKERTANIVMQYQGTIGVDLPDYTDTNKIWIENIHNAWGIAYPGGIAPNDTDANSLWWEWVIDAFITKIESLGATIDGFTFLGAIPEGISNFHPDVIDLLLEKVYSKNVFDRPAVELTDNLVVNESIFISATNASIVDDSGTNCQKLAGYGTIAYGNIKLADNRINLATYTRISFFVKYIQGTALFSSLNVFSGYGDGSISYGSDITASINTWHKVTLQWSGDYYDVRIYNEAGESIYIKRNTYSNKTNKGGRLRIVSNANDILIKGLKINYSWDRCLTNYPFANAAKWDDSTAYANQTAAQWLDVMKAGTISMIKRGGAPYFFSHHVKDPAIKANDATYQGILDRSYWGMSQWVEWCKSQGYEFVNSKTIPITVINRTNQMPDLGPFNMSEDISEVANSLDDSPIYKLIGGQESVLFIDFKSTGLKHIKMYAKGTFYLYIETNYRRIALNHVTHKFINDAYTLISIPIHVDENYGITKHVLTLVASTDCFFNRILIDD